MASKLDALNEAVEAMRRAMISGDRSELDRLTAAELTHGHTSGRVENKQQFIDGVASGRSSFSEIALSEQTATLMDDVAVVHHLVQCKRRNPPPGNSTNKMKVMAVWLFRKGQWKILARQAMKIEG